MRAFGPWIREQDREAWRSSMKIYDKQVLFRWKASPFPKKKALTENIFI